MQHLVDHNDLTYAKKRFPDIVGWVPNVRGQGGKINPHLTRFVTKRKTFVDVFHVKPIYYETLTGHWRPLTEVCTIHGNHKIIFKPEAFTSVHPRYLDWLIKRQALLSGEVAFDSPFGSINSFVKYAQEMVTVPRIGLTTTTVYPDANPETSTVDGGVVVNIANPGETWATITGRASGTGAVPSNANGYDAYIIHANTTDQFKYLGRSFFLFDTSAIDDADTIDSGILSLFHLDAAVDNSPAQTYSISSSNPASNTNLTTADYSAVGSTLLASEIAGSAVTRNAYNDFTLNASGEANVSKTGLSKFAMRLKDDLDGTSPAWTSGVAAGFFSVYAETATEAQDPKLVIEHSAGGGSSARNAIFFGGM